MRSTLLRWHHFFKFSGKDRPRNGVGGVGTCCWTLVAVKLCWFKYWYTVIIYVSLILPNAVSFFFIKMRVKDDLKSHSKLWLACVIPHLCHEHSWSGFESLFIRQLLATNRAFVEGSILFDYFYIEWAHIIIYITVGTWIQCIHCQHSIPLELTHRGNCKTSCINHNR